MRNLVLLGLAIATFVAAQNVGIGTATPTQRLDVNGNVQFSGALMPAGNPGAIGQVLVSRGPNTSPVWEGPYYKLFAVDAWNPATSATEYRGWSCTGCASTPWTSTCGQMRLLGGCNVCGRWMLL
ncbi:MAG: hypothetical protein KatS3mg026_1633 [Bacteroidia bacterium]|nr:MAG: hypothetical protein KatS3mg026_1633 [Bacteroidia bacterium]